MTTELNKNEIIDSLGRKIKLKKINGKTRIAFYRALGSKDASNIGILGEYWPVMAVESIDDAACGSIKGLADIDYIYNELEKGNALQEVEKWLNETDAQSSLQEKEEKELKK